MNAEEFMKTEEFQKLTERITKQVIDQMNQKTFRKSAFVLHDVQKKYDGRLLRQEFENPKGFRIWECVRKMTALIMDKSRIDELEENEVEQAKQIATDLCEYAIKVHRERKSKSC